MNGCKFNNQDTKFCFLFSKIMDELRIYFIIYTFKRIKREHWEEKD